MTQYKSRRRWQLERWLDKRKDQLQSIGSSCSEQLLPASWTQRCQRCRSWPMVTPALDPGRAPALPSWPCC